jgi:hypothetical protein
MILNYVHKKYGTSASRFCWSVICFVGLAVSIITFDFIYTVLMGGIFLVGKHMFRKMDTEKMTMYKSLFPERWKLVNTGWAETYRAKEIQSTLVRLFLGLPKDKQDEIQAWEKQYISENPL